MKPASADFLTLSEQHARAMAARSRMWAAGRRTPVAPAVVAARQPEQVAVAPAPTPPPRPRPIPVYKPGERWAVVDILTLVSAITGFSAAEIKGRSRKQDVVRARQTFCWLVYRFGRAGSVIGKDQAPSLPAIGRFLCGRDHTTVLHGVRKVERAIVGRPFVEDGPRTWLNALIADGFVRAAP